MVVPCTTCGTSVQRPPSQIRKSRRIFCSSRCYLATRGQNHVTWRQGTRIARKVVAKYFDLQPSHVVHHEDSDERNNRIQNLKVFASQSDHMKYHHGGSVPILFDGSQILEEVLA